MLSAVGEDRKQLENRTRLLHDTLSRKVYPRVANEYSETDWDELLNSFALASKQLDDLSGNLKAVYSMQIPAPKKPMPADQHPIPQILSTMMDKGDASKIERASEGHDLSDLWGLNLRADIHCEPFS